MNENSFESDSGSPMRKDFDYIIEFLFDKISNPMGILIHQQQISAINEAASTLFQRWGISQRDPKCFVGDQGLFTPFPFYNYCIIKPRIQSRFSCFVLKKNDLYQPEQRNWFLDQKNDSLVSFFHWEGLTDPLTELPDRSIRLSDYFSLWACSGVLIFCDIRGFKNINDHYGHLFGDKTLEMVAKMLSDTFPAPSLPIRYGGDEFLIFCPFSTKEHCHAIMKTMFLNGLKNVSHYFNINEEYPDIKLDYGLSDFKPGDRFNDVFKKADDDFYSRKKI